MGAYNQWVILNLALEPPKISARHWNQPIIQQNKPFLQPPSQWTSQTFNKAINHPINQQTED